MTHSPPPSHVRTKQFGQYTRRNPAIIDDGRLYRRIVGRNIRKLVTEGKDKRPNKHFTYQVGFL